MLDAFMASQIEDIEVCAVIRFTIFVSSFWFLSEAEILRRCAIIKLRDHSYGEAPQQ